MVAADGSVYAFGDAAHLGNSTPRAGAAVTDLEPTPSGAGYWIVDSTGAVAAFGDASHYGDAGAFRLAADEQVVYHFWSWLLAVHLAGPCPGLR